MRVQTEIVPGNLEGQAAFLQENQCEDNAECLGEYCRKRCACRIQMKTGDQYQITDNVDDAGNQHEEQRGAAVTQSAEDCGQQVIGDDEEDTAAADPDISCCQTDCFFRCLHQDGDGAGEADHTDEQDAGENREYYDRAADDRADEIGALLTQIAGDQDRDAHGELCDNKSDKIQYLAAGGYGREAGGRAEPADN